MIDRAATPIQVRQLGGLVAVGVDVVAEPEEKVGLDRPHRIPDALVGIELDAAARADSQGLNPGLVLNHRPGSRATPGYVGAATSAVVRQELARW